MKFIPFTKIVASALLMVVSQTSIAKIQQRIINGTDVTEVPGYHVLVYVERSVVDGVTNFSYCSGTVVSPREVVTAAHCFENYTGDSSGIRVHHQPKEVDIHASQYSVTDYVIHPEYDRPYLLNDIAIVVVSEDLPTGGPNDTLTVPMSDDSLNYENAEMTLYGFGQDRLDENNKSYREDKTPEMTTLFVPAPGTCQKFWGYAGSKEEDLCLDSREKQLACNGDSGGGLESDGYFVGIISYGFCHRGYTVATRVAVHYDFINGGYAMNLENSDYAEDYLEDYAEETNSSAKKGGGSHSIVSIVMMLAFGFIIRSKKKSI